MINTYFIELLIVSGTLLGFRSTWSLLLRTSQFRWHDICVNKSFNTLLLKMHKKGIYKDCESVDGCKEIISKSALGCLCPVTLKLHSEGHIGAC